MPCERCQSCAETCGYCGVDGLGDLRSHRPSAQDYEDLLQHSFVLEGLFNALRSGTAEPPLQRIREGASLSELSEALTSTTQPSTQGGAPGPNLADIWSRRLSTDKYPTPAMKDRPDQPDQPNQPAGSDEASLHEERWSFQQFGNDSSSAHQGRHHSIVRRIHMPPEPPNSFKPKASSLHSVVDGVVIRASTAANETHVSQICNFCIFDAL